MKTVGTTENLKKAPMLVVRMSEEGMAKLHAMREKSGGSMSSVVRDLVDKGTVEVIFNGKALIKDLATAHNKFNQFGRKISGDIQAVKKDIEEIKMCMQNRGLESEEFRMYLTRASIRLDDFQTQYNERENRWRSDSSLRGR